jgi:citrate lyase beta subunit
MICDKRIFQFMSIHESALLKRLLTKTLKQDCTIVIDLEDTLDDFDRRKSKSIKEWGRKELIKFAQAFPSFFDNEKIGVRINGIRTLEFEKDLPALVEISKIWNIESIIGPKIESKSDILENIYQLEIKKIKYQIFIPIIETIKGIENLSSIIDNTNICYAIYGHNDYSLDSHHFPFWEHNQIEFWKIVSFFIKTVESKNIQYIHPPIPYSSNSKLFELVCWQLQKKCSFPFGMIAVNSQQAMLLKNIKTISISNEEIELKSKSYSYDEKFKLAMHIKELFSQKKRSFCNDLKNKKFITPHEYISAINFLEKKHDF